MKKKCYGIIIFLLFCNTYAQNNPIEVTPNVAYVTFYETNSATVSYTVTNNTIYRLPAITVDPDFNNDGTPTIPVTFNVNNNTCSVLSPGQSCSFDIEIVGTGSATSFELQPLVCGLGCISCFPPSPSNFVHVAVLPDQVAYIANSGTNTISLCAINPDTGLLFNCSSLTDPTFNNPVDIILNNDNSLAYVANSNDNVLSICPVNGDFNLAACTDHTDPSFNFNVSGLYLNNDDFTLFATSTTAGINGTVSACNVSGGTLNGCITSGQFIAPIGRINYSTSSLNGFFAQAATIANPSDPATVQNGIINICSLTNCSRSSGNGILNYPTGASFNSTQSYLYIPNTNIISGSGDSAVAVCPVSEDGKYVEFCNSFTDVSFNFNESVNNLTTNSGYIYFPNPTINTISVCALKSDGSFFNCTTVSDPTFNTPSSVWITPGTLPSPVRKPRLAQQSQARHSPSILCNEPTADKALYEQAL